MRSHRLVAVYGFSVEPSAEPGPAGVLGPAGVPDAAALLRSRLYVTALVLAALVGIPIAMVAYGYLAAVSKSQTWLYLSLPSDLGFSSTPWWWPLPLLVIGGFLVAASITFLPGTSGHEPAEGLVLAGSPSPPELLGVVAASFVTLASGAVLGPEAPLIAIGGGLAAWSVHAVKRDAPAQAALVIGAAGSFAAVSTLLGSPLVGAFLLMEVVGIGGPMLGVILVPGLLAAGIGSLIFIGLGSITGLGTFSLGLPGLATVTSPSVGEFLWAVAIGVAAAVVGTLVRRGARAVQAVVARRRLLVTPLLGAGIAGVAIAFGQISGHGANEVLFSGENSLDGLIVHSSSWAAGALMALLVAKGLAYLMSLAGFRGGPIFPALFLGGALGILASHLPGLSPVAGAAMGIGAMTVTMLGLPLTAVLLTTLLLSADAVPLMPLIIVAVVVAYVISARLTPARPSDSLPVP